MSEDNKPSLRVSPEAVGIPVRVGALSLNDIATLLNDNSIRPKPKQIGLLRYNLKFSKCTTCGVVCSITIDGTYYCTTHALYALNAEQDDVLATIGMCTCDAGRKTMNSLHTSDCAIYDQLSE